MGHRGGARWFLFAVVTGATLFCAPSAVAQSEPTPPDPTTDETLLPPAPDDEVQIVPTDQRPEAPPTTETVEPSADQAKTDLSGPGGVAAVVLLVLASVVLTALATARLVRMLFAWRSPASLGAAGFTPAGPPTTSFSLLVPARRSDPAVLKATLHQLASLDHPNVEVVAVVPQEDAAIRAAVLAAKVRHPGRIHEAVDRSFRRARGAGLNAALEECAGEVVGVIEPGDTVHPRLLRHVDSCFALTSVAAVQGGVQLVAPKPRWFSARSAVERYFWSRSRLHLHATQHFAPLESSTVFVRTQTLRDSGGWDERCVAEGCELGVRLSVEGQSIVVAYDPELATQQLAPPTTRALMAERIRWIRGFVQVLHQGVWRQLPTRSQRLRARLVLARPLVEAAAGVAILAAAVLGAALAGRHPGLGLVLLLPAIPALMTVGVEIEALAELARSHDRPRRRRDQLALVLSTLPYKLLVATAALRVGLGEIWPWERLPAMPVTAPASSEEERLERLDEMNEVDLTTSEPIVDLPVRRKPPAPELPVASGER
jgi:hypothetical protein